MARGAPRPSFSLSRLQLAVLRVLWEREEATVVEVREALAPERELAVTTVATLLSRLLEKGLVRRRSSGRHYVYRATITQDQVGHSMLAEVTDALFGGDPLALVRQLLADREIEDEELSELRALIDAHERRRRRR